MDECVICSGTGWIDVYYPGDEMERQPPERSEQRFHSYVRRIHLLLGSCWSVARRWRKRVGSRFVAEVRCSSPCK